MAGSILLTDEIQWSASTIAFSIVVELTKKQFDDRHIETLKEVYLPFDQASDFLSLVGLDSSCFHLFYDRCTKGYDEFMNDESREHALGNLYRGISESWKELLEMLRADQRYVAFSG